MIDTPHLALVHDNQLLRPRRQSRNAELRRFDADEHVPPRAESSPPPAIAVLDKTASPQPAQGSTEFQALVRRVEDGENPHRLLAGLKARRVEIEQALQEVQSNIQVLAIAIVLKERGLL
jgi:hypothetical protein